MTITYAQITNNIKLDFYNPKTYWPNVTTPEEEDAIQKEAAEEFWEHCRLAGGLSETEHIVLVKHVQEVGVLKSAGHSSLLSWYKFAANYILKLKTENTIKN